MKAFPTEHAVAGTMDVKADGMDLRDYFAAKAMQGILASTQDEQWFFDSIANMAYLMADTMMERRSK
jgi:hypothetical protein